MQKNLTLIPLYLFLALLACASISGCSVIKFPGVYRIAVQQGNIIDQKKVDQLVLGMDKRQVQFVMGSPLVNDVFHDDRWDYVYTLRRGDKLLRNKRFTLFFDKDLLVRFEGDVAPNTQQPKVDETYIEDAEKT
jgi:outer membrane protein assembly factor BamE